MGIFVDYPSNIFAGLKEIPTTIVTASTNVLWVTTITVCNRGAAPIRFNLQKVRTQGLDLEIACYVTTTSNLMVTYNNGTSGVGATLTNTGTLAVLTLDGLTPVLNARILVKNQSNPIQNGIYTLTTLGNGSTPWVLTRSTDYNIASKIHTDDLIPITNGTVNANTIWRQTSTITTIGINPITFIPNINTTIFYINEFEIAPYETVNVIDNERISIGFLNLEFSRTPYVTDSLMCFSNGYTQVFDCEVCYAQLNELPMI
jgi:hypothetical protein